jgi:general secretion pathway protein I
MDTPLARRRDAGFTLLEAMIALIIVALGMMAVDSQLNRYVVAASFVEQKTLASWIATNKITELSVANTWPELGESDDDLDFAGQKWRCHIKVSDTPVANLRRVDVSVVHPDEPDRVIDRVSGLVEPPTPAGFPPVHWSIAGGGGRS